MSLHTSRTANNLTCAIDCLNLDNDNDKKSALTLTILSVKKFHHFKFSHCALYSLYGCPLFAGNGVKVKKCLLTCKDMNPKTIL